MEYPYGKSVWGKRRLNKKKIMSVTYTKKHSADTKFRGFHPDALLTLLVARLVRCFSVSHRKTTPLLCASVRDTRMIAAQTVRTADGCYAGQL